MKKGLAPVVRGTNVNLYPISTEPEDIINYANWVNNEKFNAWIGQNDHPHTYDAEVKWATTEKDGNVKFIIAARDKHFPDNTGKDIPIGTCAISKKAGNACRYELGIMIGNTDYHSAGYGTETMKMLIKFAFNELNAHTVCLSLVADNERAFKCYAKAGFVVCGREHDAYYFHGKYADKINMEIIRSDWEKEQEKEEARND